MQYPLYRHDRHSIPRPQGPSDLPLVELEIVRGRARQKVRRAPRSVFLIGGGHYCDLVLSDPRFAEVHCYLLLDPAGVSIRHLGGGPDLWIDDVPVRAARLSNGSKIRTGPYEFAVRIRPAVRQTARGLRLFDGPSEILTADATTPLPKGPASTGRVSTGPLSIGRLPSSASPPAWPHLSSWIVAG